MTTPSLAPGVYVRYIPSGMRVIAAAGTSIAAFLGTADKEDQPPNTPIFVTSWPEFEEKFATLDSTSNPPLLTDSVYGWFTNGGGPCYIVRIPPDQDTLQPALTALADKPDVTMVAVPGLSDITGILPVNQPVQQGLVVAHCEAMGNRVALLDLPAGTPPRTQDSTSAASGGDPAQGDSAPGAADVANNIALTSVQATFATIYYPWLLAPSVYKNSPARYLPPSGHVAGTWARTDTERGVYKAPANVTVLGILGLEFSLTNETQAPLNQVGINCVRTFPGQGSLVWGARTRAAKDPSDLDFKYVNVRRYVNFLDDSITQSTRWAVFEPNNAELQAKVSGAVSSFLVDQWRTGALVGATAPEAFTVVCDSTNNTPTTMAEGNLFCDIGVALTRPAEFVYFRVTQTYS